MAKTKKPKTYTINPLSLGMVKVVYGEDGIIVECNKYPHIVGEHVENITKWAEEHGQD